MPQKIMLPEAVSACCAALRKAGHAAYPVGGGVRDLLLGRTPGDWDVTTSAPPEAILSLFPHAALTGGSHGTVTVIIADTAIEVTPFRGESGYSDGRHPDKVTFGVSLDDDLARRDFTVNALALDEGGGVIDRFGGLDDLKKGVLRCVGEADRRFREDSLRILRALRFAAVYGMVIEGRTAAALHKNRALLGRLPAERVYGELTKLLCGAHAEAVLLEYADVLLHVIDSSDPNRSEHIAVVEKLISKLAKEGTPVINVYNKADLVEPTEIPIGEDTVAISAKKGDNMSGLLKAIEKALDKGLHHIRVVLPYSMGGMVDRLHSGAQVKSVDYTGEGIEIETIVDEILYGQLRDYIKEEL